MLPGDRAGLGFDGVISLSRISCTFQTMGWRNDSRTAHLLWVGGEIVLYFPPESLLPACKVADLIPDKSSGVKYFQLQHLQAWDLLLHSLIAILCNMFSSLSPWVRAGGCDAY